jgi:hypothetical protein
LWQLIILVVSHESHLIQLLLFFCCFFFWWNTNKYTETHIYYEVLNSNSSEDIQCNNIVICSWIKTHVP